LGGKVWQCCPFARTTPVALEIAQLAGVRWKIIVASGAAIATHISKASCRAASGALDTGEARGNNLKPAGRAINTHAGAVEKEFASSTSNAIRDEGGASVMCGVSDGALEASGCTTA
jgi:hypothetical protein